MFARSTKRAQAPKKSPPPFAGVYYCVAETANRSVVYAANEDLNRNFGGR